MANEQELRIKALAEAIGTDIKTLNAAIGALSGLTTTEKSNLVGAINEVKGLIASGGGGDMLSSNNLSDLANAVTARANLGVRSSAEITSEIATAIATVTLASLGGLDETEVDARVTVGINALTNGASSAFDTLKEIQDAFGNDPDFATTVATALSNRVRYDAVQTLGATQRLQACQNIGVGNPDRDFVNDYTTVRDA